MGFYSENTNCTKCGYLKMIPWYFNTEIRPKEGVRESELNSNYCEKCETYTRWFMGKGKVEIPILIKLDDPWKEYKLSEFKSLLNKEDEKQRNLQEKIKTLNKNFILRIRHFVKLNSLMKELKYLEYDIQELQEFFEKSSKNVEFYENIKPTPKCLECGYDKLIDEPKHSCGGDIIVKTNKKFRFEPSYIIGVIFEYDEMGEVIKTNVRTDEEIERASKKLESIMRASSKSYKTESFKLLRDFKKSRLNIMERL